MKFPLAHDVFPRVQLSPQDEDVLRGVTAGLVADTLQHLNAQQQLQRRLMSAVSGSDASARTSLLDQPQRIGVVAAAMPHGDITADHHNHVVDAARWKLLKRRDNVRVYKERASFHVAQLERQWQHHRPPLPPQDPFRADANASQCEQQQQALPMMMALGSVQGRVDDVLYGLLSHTPQTAQLRAAYVDDDIVDTQVLARVTEPTAEAPLQSLAVKWCVKRHNGLARSLVRFRDFVVIDATGTTCDAHGERIGYHVVHSIAVPGVRELHERNVVRAKISMCCVFRQRRGSSNTVELFMRGFLNPLGDVPLSAAMASAAESVLSMWKTVRCAQMKKLVWSLARAADAPRRNVTRGDACEVCWRAARATSRHALRHCDVCQRRLCSRCRVVKKLHIVSRAQPALPMASVQVDHTTALFCASCVYEATQTSALELAARESVMDDGCADPYAWLSAMPPASSAALLSTRSRAFTSPSSTRSCASSVASSAYSAATWHAPATPSAATHPPLSARGSRFSKWFS